MVSNVDRRAYRSRCVTPGGVAVQSPCAGPAPKRERRAEPLRRSPRMQTSDRTRGELLSVGRLTEANMLYWALVFLVIAIIAGFLGFGGVAFAAAEIAKILFFLFLVIFVVMLLAGLMGRRRS